ncbi:ABC transporter substrate-binding protein [Breoghania corrubedonensis]|nr:ABC transporter substrate-binding protein [Breoghania corrubedonensis]
MVALALSGLALIGSAGVHAAGAPARVVSINVCTDQLAMLVAETDQLHSVSYLSREPQNSAMSEEAAAYPLNHGQAEEVFLMRPDLVLAGTYTRRATVALLKRLGFQVEQFPPATSFDDVRANLRRMGTLLARPERAEALVADLDAGLDQARATRSGRRVALSFSNSYTSGVGTLSQAVLDAAGLDNIAGELGIEGTERLPLETLIMADPDLIVSGERDYGAPALAGENFRHPAYRALARRKTFVAVATKYWVCGGPFTLQAVRILREAATASPSLARHGE